MINSSPAWAIVMCALLSCKAPIASGQHEATAQTHAQPQQSPDSAKTVYQSENLVIRQLSAHTYQHVSYLNTTSFGKVACNGMVVVNEGRAVILDTPSSDAEAQELIHYLTQELGVTVDAVVATHFHIDCLGGLKAFHEAGILSYAANRTIALAKTNGYTLPRHGFEQSYTFNLKGKDILLDFAGEGHTRDNIIAYFPQDKVLFGGCLIKEMGASKGNLEDANTAAWPATVRGIKAKYPDAKIVIPGHGKVGDAALLDYTISLFEDK